MPVVFSDYSTVQITTLTATSWWLKNPLDSTKNVAVKAADWKTQRVITAGTFYPRGRTRPIIASGEVYGIVGKLELTALDEANYNAIITLLTSAGTILLQDILGRQWYCRVTGNPGEEILKAAAIAGETSPLRHSFSLDVELTEVEAP